MRKISDEVMTREKLIPLFDDLKDFVRSTVKGSEVQLRKELRKEIDPLKEDVKLLKVAVLENGKRITALRTELKDEMRGMEKRLSDKIEGNARRLDNHEARFGSV